MDSHWFTLDQSHQSIGEIMVTIQCMFFFFVLIVSGASHGILSIHDFMISIQGSIYWGAGGRGENSPQNFCQSNLMKSRH